MENIVYKWQLRVNILMNTDVSNSGTLVRWDEPLTKFNDFKWLKHSPVITQMKQLQGSQWWLWFSGVLFITGPVFIGLMEIGTPTTQHGIDWVETQQDPPESYVFAQKRNPCPSKHRIWTWPLWPEPFTQEYDRTKRRGKRSRFIYLFWS